MAHTKLLFFVCLIVCATGYVSPPLALLAGLVFGFSFIHPYKSATRDASRLLLQASVVALGFGMNLGQVMRAGRTGFVYTAIGIASAMTLGLLLGRSLNVRNKVAYLITTGTAICGGSAIAAVAPITGADDEDIAVSLATVFVLNSVALLLFPLIGSALRMTQADFGLWAALAIHDTSSVVGATAKYGTEALAVGTTVKLARALWIVPVAMMTARLVKTRAQVQWPWFILLFCLAAVVGTYVGTFAPVYPILSALGRIGLTITLFLIGTGLSKSVLQQVGTRPLVHGIVLWVLVAAGSLAAIELGSIGF